MAWNGSVSETLPRGGGKSELPFFFPVSLLSVTLSSKDILRRRGYKNTFQKYLKVEHIWILVTRFVGLDASSGYGGGMQLSRSPTDVAGPAALWYHQAPTIEISSTGSHRAAPASSRGHGWGATALRSQCCKPKCSTVKTAD